MSYTQIYYHIVFSTKNRTPCMTKQKREDLYKYIWGVLTNKNCHLYRINGVEDHLHILTHLHPTVTLADMVKDIKLSSSDWIKENGIFKRFSGWQKGYGAFTAAQKDKDRIIRYIKNQEKHHHKKSFKEELRKLLEEAGIEFDEKYLV
ncbi:MAG: IS200/IS605 family transposase [Candidatus Marinimicrobia bacterium]|nr:IS200/IS605 family transposase [Candidatus Neomarinimicrobiota bacterium]